MRKAYKVTLIPEEQGGYTVFVPDFDCGTQGKDLADAMYMARDVIGMMGMTLQDLGKEIPEPGTVAYTPQKEEIMVYVDVDFEMYRRRHDNKKVKKTLTIPSWLNEQAEDYQINFSRTLEDALIEKLGIRK